MLPGIKVDTGAKPFAGFAGETITEGLDGLRERLGEYRNLGARFAKWRAVIDIGDGIPTPYAIQANAHALARYAALCQEADIVPIVEPEVLMDGAHSIERCEQVTDAVLARVFGELFEHRVYLEGMVLKPNMVISGKKAANRAPGDSYRPMPEAACAPRRARHRVSLRRTIPDGGDAAPVADQQARAAALVAHIQLRPRVAGHGAQGVGRSCSQLRQRAAGIRQTREAERPGNHGSLLPGDGEPGRLMEAAATLA